MVKFETHVVGHLVQEIWCQFRNWWV